jgi:hypothetical protein
MHRKFQFDLHVHISFHTRTPCADLPCANLETSRHSDGKPSNSHLGQSLSHFPLGFQLRSNRLCQVPTPCPSPPTPRPCISAMTAIGAQSANPHFPRKHQRHFIFGDSTVRVQVPQPQLHGRYTPHRCWQRTWEQFGQAQVASSLTSDPQAWHRQDSAMHPQGQSSLSAAFSSGLMTPPSDTQVEGKDFLRWIILPIMFARFSSCASQAR